MMLLSIRAPWWWFILHGGKDVENREWRYAPGYRGPVAIHASKMWIQKEINEAWEWAMAAYRDGRPAGARLTTPPPKTWRELEQFGGHIVGTCNMVDALWDYRSPWFVGPLGLVLRDPKAIAAPIPFKGALGLVEMPEDIIEQIRIAA